MNSQKAVLTIRDILHLHERRDLDAFIARSIVGWTMVSKNSKNKWVGLRPGGHKLEEIPHFHSDMSEIMLVAEQLCLKYHHFSFILVKNSQEYHIEWYDKNPANKIASVANVSASLAMAVSCVEVYKTVNRV